MVDLLVKHMVEGWQKMKILDLGCGPCNKEKDERFRDVGIVCVDIFNPHLKVCQDYGFKTLHADVRKIEKYFSDNSVDIIWILDVIEHLVKEDGLKLLDKVRKIARRQVVIWVPVGWNPQDEQDDGNIYQKHQSAWFKEDFESRGYQCKVFPHYHQDIRGLSKELSSEKEPVSKDALLAILTKSS